MFTESNGVASAAAENASSSTHNGHTASIATVLTFPKSTRSQPCHQHHIVTISQQYCSTTSYHECSFRCPKNHQCHPTCRYRSPNDLEPEGYRRNQGQTHLVGRSLDLPRDCLHRYCLHRGSRIFHLHPNLQKLHSLVTFQALLRDSLVG